MVELTFPQKPSPQPTSGALWLHSPGWRPRSRVPAEHLLLSPPAPRTAHTISWELPLCHLALLPGTPEYEVLRPILSQPKYLLLSAPSWSRLYLEWGWLPCAGEVRGQPGEAAREQGPSSALALAAPDRHRSTWAALGWTLERHRGKWKSTQSQAKTLPAGAGIMRCLQTPGAMPTQRLLLQVIRATTCWGQCPCPLPQAPSAPSAKSQRSPLSL